MNADAGTREVWNTKIGQPIAGRLNVSRWLPVSYFQALGISDEIFLSERHVAGRSLAIRRRSLLKTIWVDG